MKLIFIYGPPATGKLTVANVLAEKTGYKVFHNHYTVDLLVSLFAFGSKEFKRLNRKFRVELFGALTKEGKEKGLIFTFCYGYPEENRFIISVVRAVEKYGGKVCFVQIYSDVEVLRERVRNASRKKFKKIHTVIELDKSLIDWDWHTPIPFVESLSIDNSDMSPENVAQKIVKHYKL